MVRRMQRSAVARESLPPLADVGAALEALASLAHAATGVDAIHVDLADLRGYHYYTGATFSVFAEGEHGAIADCGRGGRYDGVGRAFGRARPATGFSLDLRRLARSSAGEVEASTIVAPADPDPALARTIAELRAHGERVIIRLPGEASGDTRRLVQDGGTWRIE